MQLATVTTGSRAAADPAAVEDIHVRTYGEMEEQNNHHQKLEAVEDPAHDPSMNGHLMKRLLWHGGSVYDAWFSAASNQVGAPDHQLNCKHIAAAELEVHICIYIAASKQP